MAASTELTTVAKLKEYLGLASAEHDELLQNLAAAAAEAVERYCGREFALLQRTEYHDGQGAASLVLKCRPVTAVAAVYDDPARAYGDGTLLAASGYTFYPDEGVLRLDAGRFQRGARNVKVVYTAGYATVPPAVEQAANILAAHFFNRGAQRGDGVESERAGSYTVSYDAASWPAAVAALLADFREAGM